MTDRDRLILDITKSDKATNEKCKNCTDPKGSSTYCAKCACEQLADNLLADGWIRPPCKVGDLVYVIYPDPRYNWGNKESKILELKVYAFRYFDNKVTVEIRGDGKYITWDISCFGVCVFLTKEEAEEKLKEREGK